MCRTIAPSKKASATKYYSPRLVQRTKPVKIKRMGVLGGNSFLPSYIVFIFGEHSLPNKKL
jgi:hypothetical protein